MFIEVILLIPVYDNEYLEYTINYMFLHSDDVEATG